MTKATATVGGLLNEARHCFAEGDLDDSALESRILIAGLLGMTATELISHNRDSVDDQTAQAVRDAIKRRLAHEPVHRILGNREFYGLSMSLSKDTLEPRPDTEILVDTLLPYISDLAKHHDSLHILDMGTGTGAIALALVKEFPEAVATGSDISPGALRTAAGNAAANGLKDRFKTIESDWFSAIHGRFHVIVSNPPYIASSVITTLAPEVRMFDPLAALDGGLDGLDAYRAIANKGEQFLHDDGIIGLEIGYDQRIAIGTIFEDAGFELIEASKDYGGNDRALLFRRNTRR